METPSLSIFKRREEKSAGPKEAWRTADVGWDGSMTLTDPEGYFGGSEAVQKHLDFLGRHKKRLEKKRELKAKAALARAGVRVR